MLPLAATFGPGETSPDPRSSKFFGKPRSNVGLMRQTLVVVVGLNRARDEQAPAGETGIGKGRTSETFPRGFESRPGDVVDVELMHDADQPVGRDLIADTAVCEGQAQAASVLPGGAWYGRVGHCV